MDFVTNDHSLLLHSAKMMFLAAMTWIVPVVLGAPHLSSLPRDLNEASLLIKFDKTSLEQEVVVVDMESQVLGQSCSKTLDSGAFADFPISTDLDSNGAGNFETVFQFSFAYSTSCADTDTI